MTQHDPGRDALAALDAALAAAPRKDGPDLSAALRSLGAYRDAAIGAFREQPDAPRRAALAQVNGVISCVMAAQYPLGEVPWPSVRQARDCLAALVAHAREATPSP